MIEYEYLFYFFFISVAGVLSVTDCEDQLYDLESFLDAKV